LQVKLIKLIAGITFFYDEDVSLVFGVSCLVFWGVGGETPAATDVRKAAAGATKKVFSVKF
jgi:hypothetical protein